MPFETEVKLRVESHEPTRARLGTAGGQWVGRVLETNWILDFPDSSLRKKGCGLRVRRAVEHGTGNEEVTLTFKGPRGPGRIKSREEIETIVSDADTTIEILGALGLTTSLRYEKRRESWRLGACKVELDEPPEIGLFIEIEGPDETSIRQVQRQLGLAETEIEPSSYAAMLVQYCEANGLRHRTLELRPSD